VHPVQEGDVAKALLPLLVANPRGRDKHFCQSRPRGPRRNTGNFLIVYV